MTARSAFGLLWLFKNANSKSSERIVSLARKSSFLFIRCVLCSVRVISISRDIKIIQLDRDLILINEMQTAYSVLQRNVCVVVFSTKKQFLRFSCCLAREFLAENYFFQSFCLVSPISIDNGVFIVSLIFIPIPYSNDDLWQTKQFKCKSSGWVVSAKPKLTGLSD